MMAEAIARDVSRHQAIGGSLGSFEGVSNGQSDVLAPVPDRVILERRPPLKADAIEARRGRGAEDVANHESLHNVDKLRG